MSTALIISIFSLAFCFFIFFYVKWYIKRRTSAEGLLAEYRNEVYRLIAEIDAATDRDSRLIEDRIKTLKSILAETDKRVSVYARELERSRSGEALYTSLGRGIRAALNTPPADEIKPPPAPTPQPSAQWLASQAEPAPQAPVSQAAAEPPEEPPSRQQIRDQIANLAAQGLAHGEIASRLDLSLSEVELTMYMLERHSQE